MRISWNWLSELVDLSGLKDGPSQLAEILTHRGLEVEAIERLDQGLERVVTAKILERAKHPQADRLSVCSVSAGKGEPLQIVCGAQNMKAGDCVALAQVGASLPNGLKIEKSKIRGVESFGMLCSEEELKFKNTSEGILILPASTPIGKPLAEILSRNDTVLVFKLTANRSDCLSHLGLAREVAAALGTKVKIPAISPLKFDGKSPISIHLDAGDSAPQFFGCAIDGVKIGPSPEWLVKRLEVLGSRSINNVVDATNLVMLEMGHPTHAYDAELIKGKEIHARMAKAGESLVLLDGQTVSLSGTELVIADKECAIGLAGVMGGGNSEVRDTTTRLFLECAEFEPRLIRRASSKHQRRTEASHRFERGIDPMALSDVISRLAGLIMELAGGKVVGATSVQTQARAKHPRKVIQVDVDYFENFLGMPVPADRAEKILKGLDCQVQKNGNAWSVTVPSFRRDLAIREDLAEEIARSIGYGEIRETVPTLSSAPQSIFSAASAARMALMNQAKDALKQAGLSETVNFAFSSKAWLARFGMTSSAALLNPLSEEHEALVPSLLPGLIKNGIDCANHHFGSEPLAIRLFELRPTFHFSGSEILAKSELDTGVVERWKLSTVISGPRLAGGLRNELGLVDFYDVKGIFEALIESLGAKGVRMQPMNAAKLGEGNALGALFHPGKSVEILAGKESAGYIGLLHPGKARELKIDAPTWIAELDWEMVSKLSRPVYEGASFKPWSEFPAIERDFALVVRNDVSADKITQLALKAGKPLAKVVKIFDVYRGPQVAEGMTSVAVRVIFYEESRSLQEVEAEAASAQILTAWKKELAAELRS